MLKFSCFILSTYLANCDALEPVAKRSIPEPRSLPTMEISYSNAISPVDKIRAHMRIFSDGSQVYSAPIKFGYRGATSLTFAKKQYKLSINKKYAHISILGLGPLKKYVLSAPYQDASLVRNALTYSLARQLGFIAPKTRFVRLVLQKHGHKRKMGLYVLTEKPGIQFLDNHSSNPVRLMFRLGRKKDDPHTVTMSRKRVMIHESSPQASMDINKLGIRLNEFEGSLFHSRNWKDHIDLPSAAHVFLLQELSRNVDAYVKSSFYHLFSDLRLQFGPIWDFNFAYGNACYNDGEASEGWYAEYKSQQKPWMMYLLRKQEFRQTVTKMWEANYHDVFSQTALIKRIDNLLLKVSPGVDENFLIWPSVESTARCRPFINHQLEVKFLKSWITKRQAWMDKTIRGWTF